jgi:hypothetical protein
MSERQALKHDFHLAANWNTGNRGRHEDGRQGAGYDPAQERR